MRNFLLSLSLLVFSAVTVFGQKTISGTVASSDDGSSIPGVNVVLKGTTTGTVTDISGNYTISVPSDGGILVYSFIGYTTQEVTIGNQSTINVTLATEVTQLTEIVISGYSPTTQKKLVSSVAVVDNSAIENVALPSVDQIIQGRAAGVYSTAPSGQPGAAQDIRIRGTGSISAGRGPLYVIDGIIMENGDFTTQNQTNDVLANINPNDIANVTVLKDASATALYGSRASNGVILITTKQGRVGRTNINARVQYGQTRPLLGNFVMMTGAEQWAYEREILQLDGGFTQADIDAIRPASLLDDTFDWLDAAFDTGTTENYELSADGGNEKTRFFVSGGYFHQDGTLIENDLKRYSFRTNLQHTASDRFELGLNYNLSYVDQLGAVAGNRFQSPLAQSFTHTPMQSAINPATGEYYTGLEPDFMTAVIGDNFLYSQPINITKNWNLRNIAQVYGRIKITDWLSFTEKLGLDFISIKEIDFDDPTTNDGADTNGSLENAFNENITYTTQSLFNFDYPINQDHAIDGVVGFEFQKNLRENFQAGGIQVASGKLRTLDSFAEPNFVSGFKSSYTFLSYLAQVNYNFKERYFLTTSVRNDASSRFSEDNQNAIFWSVGSSWRFIDEAFADNLDFLSDGRLRVSYGTTGNAEIGNFASLGLYSFDVNYLGSPGSRPSQIANPNLTWEKSNTFDVGLDVGFFGGRINITADYYRRVSTDLLLNVPVSQTTGFTSATQNIGEMENKGIEFAISTVNVRGTLNWTTDFNISANTNKILSLPNGEDIPNGNQIIREGEPIRSHYMREWAGVDPANGDPLWYQDVLGSDGEPTGERITVNTYSSATRYIVGNAEPTFLGGLDNTLSYKGVSLNFFFYYAQGHKINNSSKRFIDSDGTRFGWNHLQSAGEDFWTPSNTNASRPLPKVGGNQGGANTSTRYLEDASFVRLRNVRLGYSLPSSLLENSGLQRINVYLQGQNLLTITDYSGFDPEADENGDEFFRYPVGASLTMGLDITF